MVRRAARPRALGRHRGDGRRAWSCSCSAAGPVGSTDFETEHTARALPRGRGHAGARPRRRRFSRERPAASLLGALAGIAYGGSPISTRALVDPHLDAETIGAGAHRSASTACWGSGCVDRAATGCGHGRERAADAAGDVRPGRGRDRRVRRPVRAGWWPVAVLGFALEHAGRAGAVRRRGQAGARRAARHSNPPPSRSIR